MKRAEALRIIQNAMPAEEGKRTITASRSRRVIHAPGLSQRIVDPRTAAVEILDALNAAGVLVELESE